MSSKKPAPISASALAFSFSTPKSGSKTKSSSKNGNLGQVSPFPLARTPYTASASTIKPKAETLDQEKDGSVGQDSLPERSSKAVSTPVKCEPGHSEEDKIGSHIYSKSKTPRPASPAREATPLRSLSSQAQDLKPNITSIPPALETPRRPFSLTKNAVLPTSAQPGSALKPLGAYNLTTPLPPRYSTAGAHNAEAGPSSTSINSNGGKRPLLRKINEVTPKHEVTPEEKKHGSKARLALNETLLSDRTADDLFTASKRKAAMLVEEDEGIGVSPRGKKIAKWAGKGPPPPSVHLSNLLSSSHASLHLFYTSLQQTLYPSHRDRDRDRKRGFASARQYGMSDASSTAINARSTAPSSGLSSVSAAVPTAFQHIQSAAPIRLRISAGQGIGGPTHQCTIFWCDVLKWHYNDLTGDSKSRQRDAYVVAEDSSARSPRRVLVVFQILPHQCPKLGVDPRLLALRMSDTIGGARRRNSDGSGIDGASGKKWQVGIWQSSEIVLPVGSTKLSKSTSDYGEDNQIGEGREEEKHDEDDGEDQAIKRTTALLATRYLIAEQPSE
ncbi:hypothetical protein I317_02723 [Kwoniella heveanensis CBS 569]|nr:hypothetical protein I317_02723 [Kwoniella heveanensis CBS 569]